MASYLLQTLAPGTAGVKEMLAGQVENEVSPSRVYAHAFFALGFRLGFFVLGFSPSAVFALGLSPWGFRP